ncbi:hypothetical protein PLESTF_000417400 [Pleodorina starrii]|nr:hypothetical protein PLESTM_001458100 [Pleodorina starrii]GLC66371.1 hypothetical protein PLESTF_000417400 [Pleodorina starrii]
MSPCIHANRELFLEAAAFDSEAAALNKEVTAFVGEGGLSLSLVLALLGWSGGAGGGTVNQLTLSFGRRVLGDEVRLVQAPEGVQQCIWVVLAVAAVCVMEHW